ncbi:MAG: N-acetylmuramoyl-L-alanine amidase [Gammaproteobacteria bacterium]|nr:N-acetylmuramoyl-L-alanine amidase [Gammaproteobacteria bacterium]
MSDVFISYAREDSDLAHRLNTALKEGGRTTSIDVLDILPAEQWPDRVEGLIAEADSFVFAISPNWLASSACEDELALAVKFNKRLIPVVFEDVDDTAVPASAASINWLFLRESDDFDAGISALLKIFDTDSEWVREHTRLTVRAKEWKAKPSDRSTLLRGVSLQVAQSWLAQAPGKEPGPSELQSTFIDASTKAEKQRQHRTILVLALFLVVAAGLAVWAELNRREAEEQAKVARSRELIAQAQSVPATMHQRRMLLALEAARVVDGLSVDKTPVEDAIRAYLGPVNSRVLVGHAGGVERLAFSPTGDWLASASLSGLVTLWDVSGSAIERVNIWTGGTAASALAFGPDGNWLAAGFRDGKLRIWQVSDLEKPPVTWHAHNADITTLAITRDGRYLVAGSRDGGVSLWETGQLDDSATAFATLAGHNTPVTALAISPDERWLASVDEGGTALLWRMDHLDTPFRKVAISDSALAAASFQPNAGAPLLLTGGRDRNIRIWRIQAPEPAQIIGEHADSITAARYSPDGQWIATSSLDGQVYLWSASNARARSKPIVLAGHTDWVSGLTFSQESRLLATYGFDGTVRIWNLESITDTPLVLSGHELPVTALEFSPKGRLLATASRDGTIRLWQLDSDPGDVAQTFAELRDRACEFVSRNFYPDEWSVYMGEEPGRRRTCARRNLSSESQGFLIEKHRLMSITGAPVRYVSAANFGLTSEILPEFLVMHATAAPLEGTIKMFDSGQAQASAHAVIGRDGVIVQLVPFDKKAWHAGLSKWKHRSKLNSYSIGIELENLLTLKREGGKWTTWFGKPVADDEVGIAEHEHGSREQGWQRYTPAQIDVAKQLGRLLVRYYGLRDVVGHEDLAPGRKMDPGPMFPMTAFREYALPHQDDTQDTMSK